MKGNEFNKCKNLAEVALVAKRLKEKGESPVEVNQLVVKKRAELIATVGSVNNLGKVSVRASAIPKVKTTHLRLDFSGNVNGNEMVITSDKIIHF